MHKSGKLLSMLMGISALLFTSSALAEAVSDSNCNLTSLPEPVQQILAQRYPTWRVWGISDLTKEEKEHWSKNKQKSHCPGLAIGNFENKSSLSYALSLVPVDRENRGWRLIVISKIHKGIYEDKNLQQRDDLTGTGVLYKAPPGTYRDTEESMSIRLRLDGFIYAGYEKGAILFYWKNDRYHQLIISD